jgi:hypothetical protein
MPGDTPFAEMAARGRGAVTRSAAAGENGATPLFSAGGGNPSLPMLDRLINDPTARQFIKGGLDPELARNIRAEIPGAIGGALGGIAGTIGHIPRALTYAYKEHLLKPLQEGKDAARLGQEAFDKRRILPNGNAQVFHGKMGEAQAYQVSPTGEVFRQEGSRLAGVDAEDVPFDVGNYASKVRPRESILTETLVGAGVASAGAFAIGGAFAATAVGAPMGHPLNAYLRKGDAGITGRAQMEAEQSEKIRMTRPEMIGLADAEEAYYTNPSMRRRKEHAPGKYNDDGSLVFALSALRRG